MPCVGVKLAALILNLDTEGTEVLASGLHKLTLCKDPDAFWVGNWVGPELGCILEKIIAWPFRHSDLDVSIIQSTGWSLAAYWHS
jgi:hypothetical protein